MLVSTRQRGPNDRGASENYCACFPANYMLQIRSDEPDLAVRRNGGMATAGHVRTALGLRTEFMQPLRRQVFGRILRQVEVRADIGRTGTI
jgi:hypothetical protein